MKRQHKDTNHSITPKEETPQWFWIKVHIRTKCKRNVLHTKLFTPFEFQTPTCIVESGKRRENISTFSLLPTFWSQKQRRLKWATRVNGVTGDTIYSIFIWAIWVCSLKSSPPLDGWSTSQILLFRYKGKKKQSRKTKVRQTCNIWLYWFLSHMICGDLTPLETN